MFWKTQTFFQFRMHELSEKLLNFITKDGKCSNLEKMLSNVEDAKKLGNDSSPYFLRVEYSA